MQAMCSATWYSYAALACVLTKHASGVGPSVVREPGIQSGGNQLFAMDSLEGFEAVARALYTQENFFQF